MYERIGNLLNDIVVKLGFTSGQIQLNVLAGRSCCIAYGARESRVQRTNRDHARRGNLVLQVMRQFGEFVDVAFDTADKPFQL